MSGLTRRSLLVAGGALAGYCATGGAALRSWSGPNGMRNPGPASAAKPMLTPLYPVGDLPRILESGTPWHPYPTCKERAAWEGLPQSLKDALVKEGEAAQKVSWPDLSALEFLAFKRAGSSAVYDDNRTLRRQVLRNLVVAECIEDRGRFTETIVNCVWSTCEETFWGSPAHMYLQHRGSGLPDTNDPVVELFTGEAANLLAWTQYLLGSKLGAFSPLIGQRISDEVARRFLTPAYLRNDFWWMGNDPKTHPPNNWNPWINSNLLACTLLLEKDPSRRVAMIAKTMQHLDNYLAIYSPDGGCDEGPLYWGRAAASYFECIEILRSASAGRIDTFSHPFLHKMVQYIGDVHIADGYFTNFGDGPPRPVMPGEIIYRFGRATQHDALASFGVWCARQEGVLAEKATLSDQHAGLSRALSAIFSAAEMDRWGYSQLLVGDSYYTDLKLMTVRTRPNSAKGFFVGVQAAPNERSHGHNDSGSFIAYHNGDPVFIDVGTGTYTAKTFGPERYDIWTMQSQFHNLPSIGSVDEMAKSGLEAEVLDHEVVDRSASIRLQLASAFPGIAPQASWLRRLTLDRSKDEFTILDEISFQEPNTASLHFMTNRLPSMQSVGVVRLETRSKSGRTQPAVPTAPPVNLEFNHTLVRADIEKITLDDGHLRGAWGNEIYRISLVTLTPITQAKILTRCVAD